MKEMNWTREEVVRRIAIVLQHSEDKMKEIAYSAAMALDEDRGLELHREARSTKDISVGMTAAATALGIDLEELRGMKVGEEEARQFIEELKEIKKKKIAERHRNSMPEELKEILKSILD